MPPSSSSSVPLLKGGYLPVRLRLPPTWSTGAYEDQTFFYVREHQAGKGGGGGSGGDKTSDASSSGATKSKSTLFVANAPVVPGISTRLLLQSLLGRYANLARVTVVPNPRKMMAGRRQDEEGDNNEQQQETESTIASLKWTDKLQDPTFLPVVHSEGKFAHVVFETPKGMKQALRGLQDAMKPNKSRDDGRRPGLVLEPIEIQTLTDETNRIYREERKKVLDSIMADEDDNNNQSKKSRKNNDGADDDDDDDEEEGIAADQATGIHAVYARYQESMAELTRERLMAECNRVMKAYEEAEEKKKREQQIAREQPDEDGFVTVSYSSAVGSQVDLEMTKYATGNKNQQQIRRKGNMRSRRKKDAIGAQEQEDFYRFQRRENKKRTLEDLRAQFDEDLRRVKQLKEERHYRPF